MVKLVHGNQKEYQKVLHVHLQQTKGFDPEIIYNYGKGQIKFKGICLKQDSVCFIHGNVVSLYISYELNTWSRDLSTYFTLDNCLFGAVKLTKNADSDKYGCSSYGIGFNARLQFSLADGTSGKNVAIFGADKSSSVHVDNDKKIP